jgi:hypothetical protein
MGKFGGGERKFFTEVMKLFLMISKHFFSIRDGSPTHPSFFARG